MGFFYSVVGRKAKTFGAFFAPNACAQHFGIRLCQCFPFFGVFAQAQYFINRVMQRRIRLKGPGSII